MFGGVRQVAYASHADASRKSLTNFENRSRVVSPMRRNLVERRVLVQRKL